MTVDEVAARVGAIKAAIPRGDHEALHGMEDSLWSDVLTAIAEGAENAADLAREALRSEDLDFSRWYA